VLYLHIGGCKRRKSSIAIMLCLFVKEQIGRQRKSEHITNFVPPTFSQVTTTIGFCQVERQSYFNYKEETTLYLCCGQERILGIFGICLDDVFCFTKCHQFSFVDPKTLSTQCFDKCKIVMDKKHGCFF